MKWLIWIFFLTATLHAEFPVTKATGSIIRTKGKIQTGSNSRIELKSPYLAVIRIGSNADFKFSPDARDLSLDSGTMMFSAPKGSGDVLIASGPVVTAINGGGALQLSNVGGRAKVVVLNGRIVTGLVTAPKKAAQLRAGEMVDVKTGATKMPRIVAINLSTMIKSSVLFNMGPFPGKAAIEKNAAKQQPKASFKIGALGPETGDPMALSIGPAGSAAVVNQIAANIRSQQAAAEAALMAQQLAQQQMAIERAEQAALRQQQQIAQQQAIQTQQEQQRRQATAQGQGPQGNQGRGPQGNQGQGNMGQGNMGQGNMGQGNQGNQGQGPGGAGPPGQQ